MDHVTQRSIELSKAAPTLKINYQDKPIDKMILKPAEPICNVMVTYLDGTCAWHHDVKTTIRTNTHITYLLTNGGVRDDQPRRRPEPGSHPLHPLHLIGTYNDCH